jgi:hypothetical protein
VAVWALALYVLYLALAFGGLLVMVVPPRG